MATIMVVEDNAAGSRALARRLERRGYNVLQAVDGVEAVILAREGAPDLILMNASLPGLDRWESPHIPVIRLSATSPEQFEQVLETIVRVLPEEPAR